MIEFLLPFAVGLLMSLVLTPVARRVGRSVGLVDRPDARRKLHSGAIPVAGGPAVLVAVTCAALVTFWSGPYTLLADPLGGTLLGLLVAGILICGVGVLDDAQGLRGKYKLLGQIVAVGVVIASGVRVERVHLFTWGIELGVFGIPLTVFFLLGAINSLNLLDGMDGLLGSVGLIVCVAFGAMAAVTGQPAAAVVAFGLAGALVGFLRYNVPPATIYMGDSGSMLVGLVVGVLAIHGSMKGPATLALASPLCVLILPIFDTSAAIVRRKLAGRSIFCTDRGHLHHCLLQSGLSRRGSLAVVVGLSLIAMGGGLSSIALSNETAAGIAAAAVVGILVTTRLFGYNELVLLYQRLVYMSRSVFPPEGGDPRMTVRIQGTIDWVVVWDAVVSKAGRIRLHHLRLDIDDPLLGESFHARMDGPAGPISEVSRSLKIDFPLSVQGRVIGRIEVSADRTDTSSKVMLGLLTDLVHEAEEHTAGLIKRGARQPSAAAGWVSDAFAPAKLEPAVAS